MMTLRPLLQIGETHSEELTASLVDCVHKSNVTTRYQFVGVKDLRDSVSEIYRHLSDGLSTRNEFDLEKRYRTIGARRAQQGIPFTQVAWAIVFTKGNLWEFLRKNLEMHPAAVFTDLSLLESIDTFFRSCYLLGRTRIRKKQNEMQTQEATETPKLRNCALTRSPPGY